MVMPEASRPAAHQINQVAWGVSFILQDSMLNMQTYRLWTIAAIVFLIAADVTAVEQEQSRQPNILWLTIEDTSFLFGCYGDKVAKTPNIDRLAKEGTRFTNAFASSPVCSPARSALITGMHVGQLGVGHHRSVVKIPDSVKGYPTYLRQAGYYCTNHTKNDFNFAGWREFAKECWDDNSNQSHWRGRKPGQPFFSVFNYVDSHQSRTSVNSYARFQKNIQSQLSPDEITSPDEVVLPPFYRDSPEMRQAYARVYDCITLVDKQVGRRLQELEDDGLADDTIVVFFPDHGQGIPRFKAFPFGLGYRVPLIVRVPEKFRDLVSLEPGTTCDRLVSFVDLGPTMLNIAGLPIPKTMSGEAVLGPNSVKKEYFYGSLNDIDATENHSRSISDGRYVYIRNYMPHLAYAQSQMYCDSADFMRFIRQDHKDGLLTGSAADFMAETRPAESLYDLKNDPWEINDLAGDPAYQATLKKMRAWNREKILQIRDLHFLHAWEIETRGGGKPAAEIRDDRNLFPLERILRVAEWSGMGADVVEQQLQTLEDSEPMCRYWALIGLQSVKSSTGQSLTPDAITAVEKLLDDPSPSVRYEAAFLCYRHSTGSDPKTCSHAKAYQVLIDGIHEDHTILVSHAMRKIVLLDQHAAAFASEVDQVEQTYKALADRQKTYEIKTSIDNIRLSIAGEVPGPLDNY
ncbi:Arylsulfatase [Rubripirellula obstinata]|uniref:Arylsulfatase n=2 Tax=Rubripirellula obstinata TaxID=406547 RepID=A0A5B1CMR9_9BACT|nr:Arylsulfatase [Rubripirellula obstinata]